MTRAHGRKGTGRTATPGEERETGESPLQSAEGSPIPGLTGNILNYAVTRQQPAVPDEQLPEFRGWLAHGVHASEHTAHERAEAERAGEPQRKPRHPATPVTPPVPPVPVFLVEQAGGGNVLLSAAPRHITVPASSGADPVRACGRNPRRARIGLLNEDPANGARFATRPSDLGNGGGALLPANGSSYQWFRTQDELFLLSAAGSSIVVSIIEEYEQEL